MVPNISAVEESHVEFKLTWNNKNKKWLGANVQQMLGYSYQM